MNRFIPQRRDDSSNYSTTILYHALNELLLIQKVFGNYYADKNMITLDMAVLVFSFIYSKYYTWHS